MVGSYKVGSHCNPTAHRQERPAATYLKSAHNKQSINVVLSHLRSNFVNVLRRKGPEEMRHEKTTD